MFKEMKILFLIFGLIVLSIAVDPFLSFLFANGQSDPTIAQVDQQSIGLSRPKIGYTAQDFADPFRLLPKTEAKTDNRQEFKKELVLPELMVTGLVWGSSSPLAIINGQVCKVGDTIENARIENISKNGVVVEFDWRKFTLPIAYIDALDKNKADSEETSNKRSVPQRGITRRPNDGL